MTINVESEASTVLVAPLSAGYQSPPLLKPKFCGIMGSGNIDMIIALAAIGFKNGDVLYNKNRMLEVIREHNGHADMVVFGETFLQGFDSLSWNYAKDVFVAVKTSDLIITEIRQEACNSKIALSFGYIEKTEEALFSSQLIIDSNGEIIDNFRRVSTGWKMPMADYHYQEGRSFSTFSFCGKKFSVGLCGDLWDDSNVVAMATLQADVVLWPVYTDFNFDKWNTSIKHEYAEQATRFCRSVLYVNSVCLDQEGDEIARGGACHFADGKVKAETAAGSESVLLVEC